MRKALAIFLALIILGTGCMCYGAAKIIPQRDDVQFTEEIIYGQKSAIQGTEVKIKAEYDNKLHWETTYTPGDQPQTSTEYTYSPVDVDQECVSKGMLDMNNYFDIDWGWDDPNNKYPGLNRAYKELVDATPAGSEKSATIRLKNYEDYYPIHTIISLPMGEGHFDSETQIYYSRQEENGTVSIEYSLQYLKEFFKIPIIDTESMDLTVFKDEAGNVTTSHSGSSEVGDAYSMYTESVYTHNAGYFTFNTRTNQGEIIDTSLIPGGYGIYRLPYHHDEDNIVYFKENDISMVYPLDPSVHVKGLLTDPADENLLLFTREDTSNFLTVIDIETMETVQRLDFTYGGPATSMHNFYVKDDYIVLSTYTEQEEYITLLTALADGSGIYQLEFSVPFINKELEIKGIQSTYWRNSSTIDAYDWNGSELIMCTTFYDNNSPIYETCGFTLAVYDASGIQYLGKYNSSLFTGSGPGSYDYYCHIGDQKPFEVSWM